MNDEGPSDYDLSASFHQAREGYDETRDRRWVAMVERMQKAEARVTELEAAAKMAITDLFYERPYCAKRGLEAVVGRAAPMASVSEPKTTEDVLQRMQEINASLRSAGEARQRASEAMCKGGCGRPAWVNHRGEVDATCGARPCVEVVQASVLAQRTNDARRCHACDQVRTDVGELPDALPLCAQCAKAHRMGYRCGEEAASLESRPETAVRCSVCGAERFRLTREGDARGACSFIGCTDPLRDYEQEVKASVTGSEEPR